MHRAFRNPIFLNLQELFGRFNHLMDVESGNPKLKMTLVHSSEVTIDSVGHNSSVDCLVSFSTLKALNAVVQSCVFGHEFERHVWNDHWSLPAAILAIVVNFEHVVSSETSECVLVVSGGFGFKTSRFLIIRSLAINVFS